MEEKSLNFKQTNEYAADLARIYNIEKAKRLELEKANNIIQSKNEELEKEKLQLRTYAEDFRKLYKQLLKANLETIYRLSIAAEFRDDDTAMHLKTISKYSKIIAESLDMDKEFINLITLASPMHDVGKIGIADNVLLKPGKLTLEEFELMKGHTSIGHQILKDSRSITLQMAELIAYTHHEKFDGSGYPRKLRNNDIPIEGRIVAVADVYEALTTVRIYKPAFSKSRALEIMGEGRGTHFDPVIFDAFLNSLHLVEQVQDEY